jgi:hypothetical protein
MIGDVQRAPEAVLAGLVGRHAARFLRDLAMGMDDREIELDADEKSISREHTFPRDCTSQEMIRDTLCDLAEDVGRRLRAAERVAGLGRLKLRWQGFQTITRQRPFVSPCCDDFSLRELAKALLAAEKLLKPVRLVGFGVSRLSRRTDQQLLLFEPKAGGSDRRERLSRAVDRIRTRHGEGAIGRARAAAGVALLAASLLAGRTALGQATNAVTDAAANAATNAMASVLTNAAANAAANSATNSAAAGATNAVPPRRALVRYPAVDAVVARLGADRWPDREAAQRALVEAGQTNRDAVLESGFRILATNADPEVRIRLWEAFRGLVPTNELDRKKGFMGVSLARTGGPVERNGQTIHPIDIMQVIPDTPAQTIGVRIGERLVRVDDQPCVEAFDVPQLVAHISSKPPGATITVVLLSDAGERTLTITLMPRPDMPGDPPIEQRREEQFERWIQENVRRVKAAMAGPTGGP